MMSEKGDGARPSDGDRWRPRGMSRVARLRGAMQIIAALPRLMRLEQAVTLCPGAVRGVGQTMTQRTMMIVSGMPAMVAAEIGGGRAVDERVGLEAGGGAVGAHEHGRDHARQCQKHAESETRCMRRPFTHGRLFAQEPPGRKALNRGPMPRHPRQKSQEHTVTDAGARCPCTCMSTIRSRAELSALGHVGASQDGDGRGWPPVSGSRKLRGVWRTWSAFNQRPPERNEATTSIRPHRRAPKTR